jgi:hypothetical protein
MGTPIIACEGNNLPEVIEDILEMEEGEVKRMLRGLSSLIDGNGECSNEGVISYVSPHFAHTSFRDYLLSSSPSGPFYVNRLEYEKTRLL